VIKRLVCRPKAIFYVYFPLLNAQVESVNIVGYQTISATGRHLSSGSTFITVGSQDAEWRLGDVVAVGMNPYNDFIQFLSTANAKTILSATYIDAAADAELGEGDGALIGWWDANAPGEISLDDEVFAAGQGFLSNFSSTGISLVYAGEVLQGETELDLGGLRHPMIANHTPVDLTLGDVSAIGMNPYNDFIQLLSESNAKTILSATYIDAAADAELGEGDGALIGWWDANAPGEVSLDDTPFPAGTAFLANFSSLSVRIVFPDPMP
jgi:hypothetical protein